MKYMLDTNVFDYLIDQGITARVPERVKIFITNVQVSEIKNVAHAERRKRLEDVLDDLKPTELVVSSPFWDDDLHWNDEAIWRDRPTNEYSIIRGASQANRDSLIVEAALSGNMQLVTSDRRCGKSAKRVGVSVLSSEEFFNLIL